MKKLIAVLAATTMLASGPALAQLFSEWDEDDSGFLTQEEYMAQAEQTEWFQAWDDDEDGLLSEDEFATGLFEIWDDDEDGSLSVAEWDQGVDRYFGEAQVDLAVSNWDDDGNEQISREEFTEAFGEAGLFAQYEDEADEDELLAEEEFLGGLFETADADDDEQISNDEFLFDDFLL